MDEDDFEDVYEDVKVSQQPAVALGSGDGRNDGAAALAPGCVGILVALLTIALSALSLSCLFRRGRFRPFRRPVRGAVVSG